MPAKKKNPLLGKLKFLAVGLVIGAVLGILGYNFFQNYNPVDKPDQAQIVAASVVFERVQSQNELVCASQKYNITEKAEKQNTVPFTDWPIPFTQNSYWYRYVGTLKVAVNLETAELVEDGTTITVTLDQPYISSNTPDMEKSEVLEEHNNVFNPISIENFDSFRAQCKEQSESEAIEGGILDEARRNAEENIRGMFNAAMGDDYEVQFVWREAEEEA